MRSFFAINRFLPKQHPQRKRLTHLLVQLESGRRVRRNCHAAEVVHYLIATGGLRLEVDLSGTERNSRRLSLVAAKSLAFLGFDVGGDGPGPKAIVGDALLLAVTVYIMTIIVLT
jgi:hypothetical protein